MSVDILSEGFWSLNKASDFLLYAMPRLHLQLAVMFFLTQSLYVLLKRFHLPRITSEILAGIILGPTVLGQIPYFTTTLFPLDGDVFLDALSKLGYILFIFLTGVKMNPRLVMTAGAGTTSAWTVGILAPLIPFAGGLTLSKYFERFLQLYRWPSFKGLISVQHIFSFPVILSLLVDLKIMNTELGRLALTATLISDLISNGLNTLASNLRIGFAGWMNAIGILNPVVMVTVIFIMVIITRPISRWIIQQTPEGRPINRVYVILLTVAVLLSSIVSDNTGLLYHHGPFILGLALPDGPPLGSSMVQKLDTMICGFFAPLLVTFCSTKVDLIQLYDIQFIRFVWTIISIYVLLKFSAVFFPALLCKMPVKDALTLAFIMCSQGIVQIAYYSHFSRSQTFDRETFSMATTSVLLIASGMQLCAKSLYDHSRIYIGYQKRDIQHISDSAELRLLVSSQRADDALAVRRILEASFPNRESPLAVYALALVELVGRAHPLLINHQLGQKSAVFSPHSQKIFEVIQSFGQQYMGMVSFQLFTAMSLPRFMHHDICSLAFEKMTSMIILPFHRKWSYQGKMISDSGSVRAINCNVLDMAPCSVAILVDRHRIKSSSIPLSTYNIAVIFIGGNDDREALAYGKRMARSPGIHLTVIRFVPWDPASENQWDAVVDAEILKEARLYSTHQDNIVYKEEKVKDGAETALQIHAMEDSFDLIMVGRRHREECPQLSGLNEWNDLPELGPIGDMLSSAEISKPLSVLVVQQQIVRAK